MIPYDKHMAECPKCGCRSIMGPAYKEVFTTPLGHTFVEHRVQHLVWTCERCGFVQRTGCKDDAKALSPEREAT